MLVAACTPPSLPNDSASATTPKLIGTVWNLTAYRDALGNLKSVLPGTQPTATFGSTGFVTGSGGCNTYSTVFQTAAMTLTFFGPIARTGLICEQAVMDQEQAYLRALPGSAAYRFEGDHLVLVQSGGAHVAEYSH